MHHTPAMTTAPTCPAWCDAPDEDWTSNSRDVVKLCSHDLEAAHTLDGEPATLTLNRLATLDQGRIDIEEPTIEIDCPGRLTRVEALRLAEAILHLVTTSAAVIAQCVA